MSDLKIEIKHLKNDVKNIQTLNRQALCSLLLSLGYEMKMPNNVFGYIHYDGSNSCFVDTALMALLHLPNCKWVNKHILSKNPPHSLHPQLQNIALHIREEIIYLFNIVHKRKKMSTTRSPKKCSILRSLFSRFDKQYGIAYPTHHMERIEWTRTQQEPTDVFNILMRIFDIPDDVQYHLVSKTTKRKEKRPFNSPTVDIESLRKNRTVHLQDVIPVNKESFPLDNGEIYSKTSTIVKAHFLQVNVNRNYLDERKITTPVIPIEQVEIGLTKKKILDCTSIIIHHGNSPTGGHYTCMLKLFKHDAWYHYDDMSDDYVLIGTFKDMMKWRDGYVSKNLVTCTYVI